MLSSVGNGGAIRLSYIRYYDRELESVPTKVQMISIQIFIEHDASLSHGWCMMTRRIVLSSEQFLGAIVTRMNVSAIPKRSCLQA